jgi:hypothetical protein
MKRTLALLFMSLILNGGEEKPLLPILGHCTRGHICLSSRRLERLYSNMVGMKFPSFFKEYEHEWLD